MNNYTILFKDFLEIFNITKKYDITYLINEYAENNLNERFFKTYSLHLLGNDWINLYENKKETYKSIDINIVKDINYEQTLNSINNETKLRYISKLVINNENIINNEHTNIIYFKDDKLDNFLNSYNNYILNIRKLNENIFNNKNISKYIDRCLDWYEHCDWNRNYNITHKKETLYYEDFIHDKYLEDIINEYYESNDISNYCKYIISIVLYRLKHMIKQNKIFRLKIRDSSIIDDIINEYSSWNTNLIEEFNDKYIDIDYNDDICYFVDNHYDKYSKIIEVTYGYL